MGTETIDFILVLIIVPGYTSLSDPCLFPTHLPGPLMASTVSLPLMGCPDLTLSSAITLLCRIRSHSSGPWRSPFLSLAPDLSLYQIILQFNFSSTKMLLGLKPSAAQNRDRLGNINLGGARVPLPLCHTHHLSDVRGLYG